MNVCVLLSWVFSVVCLVFGGVYLFYVYGYYECDNCFYQDWDLIVCDCESFIVWIDEYIWGIEDFGVFQVKFVEGK